MTRVVSTHSLYHCDEKYCINNGQVSIFSRNRERHYPLSYGVGVCVLEGSCRMCSFFPFQEAIWEQTPVSSFKIRKGSKPGLRQQPKEEEHTSMSSVALFKRIQPLGHPLPSSHPVACESKGQCSLQGMALVVLCPFCTVVTSKVLPLGSLWDISLGRWWRGFSCFIGWNAHLKP